MDEYVTAFLGAAIIGHYWFASPADHRLHCGADAASIASDHFGFAYYERNACFNFAQSEELGEYSWLTIVGDWAENLIQHEVSHLFGAEDRDRTFDPPSVMSKPSNPDQVIADFSINKLWLQVNNWLMEDILLMLANRAMFD